MRTPRVAVILTLTLLTLGAALAWGATAGYTPPPQEGTIFAVVNVNRTGGSRFTTMTVTWSTFRKSVTRANPYGNCSGPIAGYVIMVRHSDRSTAPFTLTTDGTIVRPPYQGVAPPEVGHACYKLEKMTARY